MSGATHAGPALVDAALTLAASGLPVFPCSADKSPVVRNGFLSATTDPAIIRRLFAVLGAKLIGVPTGPASGIDVLDLDYRHGATDWERANEHRLPETRVHSTMSDGRHCLFQHAEGVRNSASRIGAGVDVRGAGGYIVVPPSPGYGVVSDAPISAWPGWLLQPGLALPQPPPARPASSTRLYVPTNDKRLEAYRLKLLDNVRQAPDGAKHDRLRDNALSLGGIAAEAGFSDDDVVRWLLDALAGKHVADWRHAEDTARWALAAGRDRPIAMEDRPNPRPNGAARPHPEPPPPPNGDADRGADQADGAQAEAKPASDDDAADGETLPFTLFANIKPSLEANDFVEDLFAIASLVVIYGEPGSGKTFWLLNICLHIAAGRSWLGRAVEQGAVIYLALEGGAGIRNRIAAARDHMALPDTTPLVLVQCPVDLCASDADVAKVTATIKLIKKRLEMPVRAIVVDTLARAMAGGNENASEDMGALVVNSDRIRDDTGAAVIYIHHSGKDAARGSRGHSSLKAATDTEIEVTRGADQVSIARVTRQRDLDSEGSFPFRLEKVDLGLNKRGKVVTSCVIMPADIPPEPAGMVHLTDNEQIALRCLDQAVKADGIMATVFDDEVEGLVVREADWRIWFYREGKPGADLKAKQKAFKRAVDGLLSKGRIGSRDDLIWPKAGR